jgi:N-acetylmuramoyl-L-alanine amidase
LTAAVSLLLTLVALGSFPRGEAQAQSLRIVSREGARSLAIVSANNQDYVALDEVASAFGLTLREDRLAGGITATAGARSVIITPDQPVVSVAGRLVSLTSAPLRQGNRWLVPLDFLQRAVGPTLDTRVELRRASRLVVVGDVRIPRVTARVEPSPSGTSVIFDITPATPQRVALESGRINVTFDADALDLSLPGNTPQEFLQSVQAGDTPASVRVVPGPKFGVHRTTTSQPDANSSRLTIDLLPAGAEPPAAPPPAPPPTAPSADPLPNPLPATGVRTVVIDPGHGGAEAGAQGAKGTLEKDVTLSVARKLRTMIESRLGLRVFLTRDDDRAMSLDDRAAYANSQRADVFLSLHVNAALRPSLKGAEVYYLNAEAVSPVTDAGDQPSVMLPSLGGGARSVDLVPWDAAQSKYVRQSSALAGSLEQSLRGRVELSPRGVQAAPFRVLVGAGMPAALIEMGYVSNPEQEQALASSAYQDQIAQALFDGLVQFRAQIERATGGQQR